MEEIRTIAIGDKEYPESLKKIPDAPAILYYQGILPSTEKCVAVVGTREPSAHGQEAARKITEDLVEAGIVIVSGLAPGIDTIAHQACVEKKKRTIAVLGTGLDERSMYPRENIGLAHKIIEHGGCLISELPPHARGAKFTFPRRNRIISALSLGLVVVQAKEKSGSLIAAQFAKRQHKKLFVVAGLAPGSDSLIKEGAIPVKNGSDIVKELSSPLP